MKKLPISAMVVGYNEGVVLTECLSSINFCDEIIYTDLGSKDNSLEIASLFADKIFKRQRVPSGEYIQSEIVHYTKHEWVIFIDPDECLDETLQIQLIKEFEEISGNRLIGAVKVPWQFYFKKHKLKGTIWGGHNEKYLLVNKKRFEFLPITHFGRRLREGFISHDIELNTSATNLLHHYWMNSYKIFFRKHMRYLKNEGKDNYNNGIRVSLKKVFTTPFKEFYQSYVIHKGYNDKLVGFFLSLFWSFYKTNIYIGVYKMQLHKKTYPV